MGLEGNDEPPVAQALGGGQQGVELVGVVGVVVLLSNISLFSGTPSAQSVLAMMSWVLPA